MAISFEFGEKKVGALNRAIVSKPLLSTTSVEWPPGNNEVDLSFGWMAVQISLIITPWKKFVFHCCINKCIFPNKTGRGDYRETFIQRLIVTYAALCWQHIGKADASLGEKGVRTAGWLSWVPGCNLHVCFLFRNYCKDKGHLCSLFYGTVSKCLGKHLSRSTNTYTGNPVVRTLIAFEAFILKVG